MIGLLLALSLLTLANTAILLVRLWQARSRTSLLTKIQSQGLKTYLEMTDLRRQIQSQTLPSNSTEKSSLLIFINVLPQLLLMFRPEEIQQLWQNELSELSRLSGMDERLIVETARLRRNYPY